MITAKPSDPNVAITGSIFVRTLPKNGAVGPNKIETSTETATTKAKSLVASHNQPFIFPKKSISPPMQSRKKERGTLRAPLSHTIAK